MMTDEHGAELQGIPASHGAGPQAASGSPGSVLQETSASCDACAGKEQQKQKKHRRAKKYRRRFLVKVLFIAAVGFVLLTRILCIRRAGGNAMYPAIHEGDLVIAYRLARPVVGDAVIYRDEDGNEKMGRISAAPGMEVELDGVGYRIDGYPPAEAVVYSTKPAENGIAFPIIVPENAFFILNDFREQMDDARTMGCTPEERILGKIVFILRRRGI